MGARRSKQSVDATAAAEEPVGQTDTHQAIQTMAQRLTVPGRYTGRFSKSTALKLACQRAHAAPPRDARAAWKALSRLRKQEFRAWQNTLVTRASQIDWYAYRSLNQ